MAKEKVIVIRVDAETKQRIEEAAESEGLSLTTFVLRAASRAARAVAKKQANQENATPSSSRTRSRACPVYFKRAIQEARRGGDFGYLEAGEKLMGNAKYLVASKSREELMEKFDDLAQMIEGYDDAGVISWFDRELPRCMVLVPPRRRRSFLEGIHLEARTRSECLKP